MALFQNSSSQVSPFTDTPTPQLYGSTGDLNYHYNDLNPGQDGGEVQAAAPTTPGSFTPDAPTKTASDAYNKGTAPGQPGQPGASPNNVVTLSGTSTPDQVRQWVTNFFRSKGVTPNPTSIDYWVSKWSEFGQRDPNYFMTRVGQADEFGGSSGGTGGGAGGMAPPSPMVTPNGGIPPGIAYTNPAITNAQDSLMGRMLTTPKYSQDWQNRENETQKEMIGVAGQSAMRRFDQNAAHRGVFEGGTASANRDRIADNITQQQLQSQRGVALKTEGDNYDAFLQALMGSNNVMGTRYSNANQLGQLGLGYDRLGFDKDYANSSLYQQFLNMILNGGK